MNNLTGSGDGPVIRYTVMMRSNLDAEDAWSDLATIDAGLENETLSYYKYHVAGLEPDRQYHFSIACVRAGEGGRGPPSPILSIRVPKMEGTVTAAPVLMILLITTSVLGVMVVVLVGTVIIQCKRNQGRMGILMCC